MDYDYIVLMSDTAVEMREQLLQLGYYGEKLMHYADFFGLFPHPLQKNNGVINEKKTGKKSLLIASILLSFNHQLMNDVLKKCGNGDGKSFLRGTEVIMSILMPYVKKSRLTEAGGFCRQCIACGMKEKIFIYMEQERTGNYFINI